MDNRFHGSYPGRFIKQGPEVYCFCPKWGHREEYKPGVPCIDERCPNWGIALIRESSEHHRLMEERKELKGKK